MNQSPKNMAFTPEEEDELVQWILTTERSGITISKQDLLEGAINLVSIIKTRSPDGKFIHGTPDRHWYEAFLRRHSEITIRTSKLLTASRNNLTESNLREWHQKITEYFWNNDYTNIMLDPSRIFNVEEAAFFLNPKENKVLISRSEKYYSSIKTNTRDCLTVMITGCASGKICPPTIIYPYENIPVDIGLKVPSEWGIGRSKLGWTTKEVFYGYLGNIFHPWLVKEEVKLPIVLLLDGHSPYLSLHTSNLCKDIGIILVGLCPNGLHIVQPMDVAVFPLLETAWIEEVNKWKKEKSNVGNEVKRKDFAPILDRAIRNSITHSVLFNGFQKCGISPWNVEAINFTGLHKTPQESSNEAVSVSQQIPTCSSHPATNDESEINNSSPLEMSVDQDVEHSEVASNILRTSPQGRTSIAQIAPLVRSEGTYPTEEALPGTLERTINQVTLLGRVGADPQKRGSEEHPVVIFSLATHVNFRSDKDKGTLTQKTEWHRICVFKPGLRETVYSYAQKGQRVHVTGKLTYGEVVDSQGQTRPTASIVADDVIFFRT